MKTAKYIKLLSDIDTDHEVLGKIGGIPSIDPLERGWDQNEDEYFAFICEFDLLRILGDSCQYDFLQLYQPIDEGDDPTPIVVMAKRGESNKQVVVQSMPELKEFKIVGVPKDETQICSESITPNLLEQMQSKIGGVDNWERMSYQFFGQLKEESLFNFAGMTCVIYVDDDCNFKVDLY